MREKSYIYALITIFNTCFSTYRALSYLFKAGPFYNKIKKENNNKTYRVSLRNRVKRLIKPFLYFKPILKYLFLRDFIPLPFYFKLKMYKFKYIKAEDII
jgi:hypothetical protein